MRETNALFPHRGAATRFRFAVLLRGQVVGEIPARHAHEARAKLRAGEIVATRASSLEDVLAIRRGGSLGPVVGGGFDAD